MHIPKSWFGYVVWGLFSIILFTNIAFSAIELSENGTSSYSWPVTLLFVAGYIVLFSLGSILLYKLFMKYVYPKMQNDATESNVEKSFIHYVFLAIMLFFSVFVRFVTILASGGVLQGDDTFYKMVTDYAPLNSSVPLTNGVVIYSAFCKNVFNLFGNKLYALFAVQAFLQILSTLVTFFAIKNSFGKLAAWIAFVSLTFMPGFFLKFTEINPAALLVFFVSLYIWLLCKSVYYRKDKNTVPAIRIILYLLLGLYAAFISCYDISGLICLFISVFMFGIRPNSDDYEPESIDQKKVIRILFFLFSFIVSFLLILTLFAPNEIVGISAIKEYFVQFVPRRGFDYQILSPNAGWWDSIPVLCTVFIWYLAYLKGKSNNGIPFVFSCIVIFVLHFLSLNIFSYSILYNYIWIILSSLGVLSLSVFKETSNDVLSKQRREERKAQREYKRSVEAGEKSIQLNNVSKDDLAVTADLSVPVTTSKGYGIGLKTSEVTQDYNSQSKESIVTSKRNDSVGNLNENENKSAVTKKATENMPMNGSYNSINQTEDKKEQPIVSAQLPSKSQTKEAQVPTITKEIIKNAAEKQNQIPQPIKKTESVEKSDVTSDNSRLLQNTIIKQSAPIRRGYRKPSQSTFSPEQLEQIKQHTNGSFDYHSVEKMSSRGDVQISSENSLKNNFIHVIPDTRPVQNETKSETSAIPATPSLPPVQTQPVRQQSQSVSTAEAAVQQERPRLIHNPLPGPKPHVAKELAYDYQPKDSEMDYDLKDLSGRDYFDI